MFFIYEFFLFLSLVAIGLIVLEKTVFKGHQRIFAESFLNTILSFTGDPLQTPLLGKDNIPHYERMAFVEQWAQLVN